MPPSEFVRPTARHRPDPGPPPAWPGRGLWVGASRALGKDVPADVDPYPHICRMPYTGVFSGRQHEVQRRDCAACADDEFQHKREREAVTAA